MNLRRETPADIAAIREVETAAFGRPAEAALVDALRASGALLLSGVAEFDGNIIGHIALSSRRCDLQARPRKIAGAVACHGAGELTTRTTSNYSASKSPYSGTTRKYRCG